MHERPLHPFTGCQCNHVVPDPVPHTDPLPGFPPGPPGPGLSREPGAACAMACALPAAAHQDRTHAEYRRDVASAWSLWAGCPEAPGPSP